MKEEFIGQIIDIFEDTLADENTVLIDGSTYDTIHDQLCWLLKNWGITIDD